MLELVASSNLKIFIGSSECEVVHQESLVVEKGGF